MPNDRTDPLNDSADRVAIGDMIRWADRHVTVIDVEHVWNGRRAGVYLTVESPDVPRRRLHYWADEQVQKFGEGEDG